LFKWSLNCEKQGKTRQDAFDQVFNTTFNSVGIIQGLDVKPGCILMIVLNSIFFFLMLAFFADSHDSPAVKRLCTPARPVIAAMFLQRLVVCVGMPILLDKMNKMTKRFAEFQATIDSVLEA
jgi:hypothetical protein